MFQETEKGLVADWLLGKARSTQEAYQREIGRFLAFADKPLAEIGRGHLAEYLADLTALKFKPSTLSHVVYSIRSFWDFLVDEIVVERNPFKRIRPTVPKDTLTERILSEDEVIRLLNAFPAAETHCQEYGLRPGEDEVLDRMVQLQREGLSMWAIAKKLNGSGYRTRSGGLWRDTKCGDVLDDYHTHRGWRFAKRNELLLKVLYYSGSRVSETCALRWRDLQPRGETGQFCFYGKGSQTRSVLLPAKLYNELTALRDYVLAGDDDPLFPSHKGDGPICSRHATRIVKQAANIAGISKPISAHWFRHAHISHALDNGAPIHLIQATVGHSDMSTTGRYAHSRPNDSSGNYLPDIDPSPEQIVSQDTISFGEPVFKYHPAVAI